MIKFPEMRARGPRRGTSLPPPSGYKPLVPHFPTSDSHPTNLRGERKRLALWFGVAVGLHAALLLALWLAPPLRLKWGPPSDAWVPIKPLPAARAAAPPAPTLLPIPPIAPTLPILHAPPPADDVRPGN